MPRAAKHVPRPYLPASERREQLLETSGRLVRRSGWAGLSMQGLAAAAGVSRQLVYEHFATADDLYVATLIHLFERAYASTETIVRRGDSVEETVRQAVTVFLDLPAEERRALRSLAMETDPGRPSLARARTRLRGRIAELWVGYVRSQTGASEAESTALAWMLTTALWGLSDTIADGTIDRDGATNLFVDFVSRTLATWKGDQT
jgi:AcrR family transcriptional regulator